jgi:processive 1,2-diacylglycerol beta-glucosyltransferase
MSGRPLRILVLTSSTGGGHDMRARSLRDWGARQTAGGGPAWDVTIHQALEDTHFIYKIGVEFYNSIQCFWPGFHHIYYNLLEFVSFCGGGAKKAARGGRGDQGGFMPGRRVFMDVVRRASPDLVVSTHDHLNHGFMAAARPAMPKAPPKCVTYCGELFGGYGFSKHWVNPALDLFIGAVDECTQTARDLGMEDKRAWTGGFLLHPQFWDPRDPADEERLVRDELGLEPGRFTLLLSTGANSAQNHLALLNALVASGPLPEPAQVLALCGRNEKARATVEAWAKKHPQLPVRALPYVNNLSRLMRIASAVVARPGTGTTSEAILSGAPLLFNTLGGIMPQEVITVKFCQARGFGRVLRRPADLVAAVRGWLAQPETLAAERANVAKARPARTPLDILVKLRELMEEKV